MGESDIPEGVEEAVRLFLGAMDSAEVQAELDACVHMSLKNPMIGADNGGPPADTAGATPYTIVVPTEGGVFLARMAACCPPRRRPFWMISVGWLPGGLPPAGMVIDFTRCVPPSLWSDATCYMAGSLGALLASKVGTAQGSTIALGGNLALSATVPMAPAEVAALPPAARAVIDATPSTISLN